MNTMNIQAKYFHLNSELTLQEASELPITIHGVSLALTTQDDKISECRLTFQVSPELYQRIYREALFNLKPEIRTPLSGGNFQPSPDIQIETSLDTDLLPQLAENSPDAEQTAVYLQKLSQEHPYHPLLSPYSWYALEVKQQQETGATGYRTLWAYFNPSNINQKGIDSEKLNEAMHKFVQELTNTDSSETTEEIISQAVEQITQTFGELTNSISEMTENVVSETVEEITNALEELVENISEITEEINTSESIFEVMSDFFKAHDWQFEQIENEPTLRLIFQGDNGRWDCYARAKETEQQFLFYSICPVTVPESQRLAIAELIARVNYGMIIGNFELDFIEGEIRYKTSIDVEDDQLSFALIKSLVYTNVIMMDRYLPAIISVISDNLLPEAAINIWSLD